LRSKEYKAQNKNLKKTREKRICLYGIIRKKGFEEKKESELKQIYLKKEKTQRNIIK
jgi:hypothetical protein